MRRPKPKRHVKESKERVRARFRWDKRISDAGRDRYGVLDRRIGPMAAAIREYEDREIVRLFKAAS